MVPAVPCSNLPPGMKLFIFLSEKKRGEFDLDFLHHHREFCVCILLKWRPYIQCQTICETFFKKRKKEDQKDWHDASTILFLLLSYFTFRLICWASVRRQIA